VQRRAFGIIRVCEVLLVIIPILALLLLLTGTPWFFVPGFVVSEVTGMPSRWRRQCETRAGSVEAMTSSKRPLAGAPDTAWNGSLSPMRPSTRPPAASSSSGIASSSAIADSSVSGSRSGRGPAG